MATKKQKRRSAILAELTKLSRDGWTNATPADYQPLEAELEGRTFQSRMADTDEPVTVRVLPDGTLGV